MVWPALRAVPQLIFDGGSGVPPIGGRSGLRGLEEVVEVGDAEHGVMDAIALEATVAQDLPGLHPGEDMLDTGANLLVLTVVLGLPLGQLAAFGPAVRDHKASAGIAAVGDGGGPPDGRFGTGLGPGLAVVAVARDRDTDRDDQAGVGVDDDTVVGGVPVVLGLLGDAVVPGGHESAVHDQHRVLGKPLPLLQREQGATWSTMRSAADLDTPNSGAICRNVRLVRQ